MQRPRLILLALAAAAGLSAAGAEAADNVAKIGNLSASPRHFCAKRTSRCTNPGFTVHFTISTRAKVYADIRPRKSNLASYIEFARRFPAGANSARIDDSRLTRGRWTLKLTPVNSVGASSPEHIDVYVKK